MMIKTANKLGKAQIMDDFLHLVVNASARQLRTIAGLKLHHFVVKI